MGFGTLILATSFIVGSIAGPLSQPFESQCATTCTENNKFDYEVGKSYNYQYEANTQTRLNSNTDASSTLLLKATAEIQVISKCNLILKLKNVEFRNGANGVNSQFKSALEANDLNFAYQDGVVEAVCPPTDEPTWVLNIKRGVLSAFQNSINSFDSNHNTQETDVTGTCLTDYTVNNAGWLTDIVITKTKDTLKCTHRSNHQTWIQSMDRQTSTDAKSSPPLRSDYRCEQTLRNKVLQRVQCEETHQFQAFARSESGATTRIQQTMTLVNTVATQTPAESRVSVRKNLLMEKEKDDGVQGEAEQALNSLCDASQRDVRPEVPRLFSRLVSSLKSIDRRELDELLNRADSICPNNKRAKKILMDAAVLSGSEAGVHMMTKRILEKSVQDEQVYTWLTTLSLLPNPTKQMINVTQQLLDVEGHLSKALLAVSALTHTYCQQQPSCSKDLEVENLINNILNRFPANCQTKDEVSIEKVTNLLKALGNIGYVSEALSTIRTCYQNRENPVEVRLAAIDAHRRLPCQDQDEELVNIYLKRDEDSEVRIGAYLMLMKCPSRNTIDRIEESLMTEEINQVGSFVWTHMNSMKTSENPNKSIVKEILSSRKLQKKFSTDMRKFSRFFEGSTYFDSIEMGAHVEGSIVFSPKSYLPRSTKLGLSLDVFGQIIDLFEIGGRIEGFEQLVESFFGPEGHFPDENIHKLLESYRGAKDEESSKLKQIASIFNTKHIKNEEPKGTIYTRLFGNEMESIRFQGLDQMFKHSSDAIFDLDKLANLMLGNDVEFNENMVLVDSSITIPTCIGLPLTLKINGTTSLKIQMGGKLDASRIQTKNLLVKGHIRPSAVVAVDGLMVLDAHLAKAGLKLTTTVHTSTEAEGEIVVKDGETVKAQIELTKDKMEIFDFKSSIIKFENGNEVEVGRNKPRQEARACTGNYLSRYLGIELCGEVSYPSEAGLLSGPIETSLVLKKTDELLTTYNFEYKWSREMVNSKDGVPKYMRTGKISLDTYKSAVNRELTAEFVYNEAEETVSLRLVSPIKKATFNGKLINDPDHKKLDALVLIDDKECLAFLSELRIDSNGNSYRLTPSLSIRFNSQPMITFKGSVITQDEKKYSVDLTMEHVTAKPITISGLASRTERNGYPRYDVDVNVNSEALQIFGKWFLQSELYNVATKGTMDYKWAGEEKQSITFNAKSTLSKQNEQSKKLSIEAEFDWTLYPKASWMVMLDMQRSKDQMDNSLTIYYGPEQQRKTNALSLQHTFKGLMTQGSWPKHHIATKLRLLYPPANVDTSLEISSDLTTKSLDTSLAILSGSVKQLSFTTSLKKDRDESQKEIVSGLVRLTYPENELEVSGSITQPKIDELVITTNAKWARDAQASAILTVRNYGESKANSWGKLVTMELRLPGQQPIVLSGDVLLDNEQQSIHSEAQINGQSYKSYAEYHRPSFDNFKVSAGAVSPSSMYSASANMRYNDEEKNVNTELILGGDRRLKSDVYMRQVGNSQLFGASFVPDANNDENAIYAVQLVLSKVLLGSEGEVTLKVPSMRDVGLQWKTKTDGIFSNGQILHDGNYQVWWGLGQKIVTDVDIKALISQTSRDLSGTIKLSTPWIPLEDITVYIQHKDDVERWESRLDVSEKGNSEILTIRTDGSYSNKNDLQRLTANFKINGPIPEVLLKINHQLNKRTLLSNVLLNIDQSNEFRLTLQGSDSRSIDNYGFRGLAEVTTPYEVIRKLGLNTNVTIGGRDMTAETIINWNDKEIVADFDFYHSIIFTKGFTSRMNLKVTTPFRTLSVLTVGLSTDAKYNGLDSSIDISWNQNKKISLKTYVDPVKYSGSIQLTTPFKHFEDVILSCNVSKPFNFNLKLGWAPKRAIETDFEWVLESANSIHYKLNIESTAEVYPFRMRTEIDMLRNVDNFKLKFIGALNEKTGGINIDFSKPQHDAHDQDMRWVGKVAVETPFSDFSKANLEVEVSRDSTMKMETNFRAELNDKEVFATAVIDVMQRSSVVQINLPIENLKTIKYEAKNYIRGMKIFGTTEISWTPGSVYTMTNDLDLPDMYKLQKEYNTKIFYAPSQNPSDKTELFDMKVLFSSKPSLSDFDYSIQVSCKGQKQFDGELSNKYHSRDQVLNSDLSISIPKVNIEKVAVNTQLNLGKQTKTGLIKLNINNQHTINIKGSTLVSLPTINILLDASTTFENFKENSFKLVYDTSKKVGQLDVDIDGKQTVLALEGDSSDGKGNYVIKINTPAKGFEAMSLSTNFDLSNPNEHKLRLVGEGSSLGQFSLKTIYIKNKEGQGSVKAGAIFTSSIPNFQQMQIEYNGGKQSQSLIFTKGSNFKINLEATYNFNPSNGNLVLSLNSPWTNTDLTTNWQNAYGSKVFSIKHNIDNVITEFQYELTQKSKNEAGLRTSLITPSPILSHVAFEGSYKIEPNYKTQFSIKMEVNKATTISSSGSHVKANRNENQIELIFQSNLANLQQIKLTGNVNSLSKSLSGSIILNDQPVITLTTSANFDSSSMSSSLLLTTPLKNFNNVQFELDIKKNQNGIKSNSLISIDKSTVSADIDYRISERNLHELNMKVSAPMINRVQVNGKLDLRPNVKQIMDLILSYGDEKYQLTSEYDARQSEFLEYNLRMTSPTEESRFYASYNIQGVHNVSYDIKLIKGKSMIETRSRFYASRDLSRVQGNVVFNTNFNTMIAATLNGQYELNNDKREISLQSNVNGQNNELMATFTKSSSKVEVDVTGESAYLQLRKLTLRGAIETKGASRDISLTMGINESNFSIKGTITTQSDSSQGTLTITTPYLEHQSLQVTYNRQPGNLVITIINNNEQLAQVKVKLTQNGIKTDLVFEFLSSMPWIESITAELNYDPTFIQLSIDSQTLNFDGLLSVTKTTSELKFLADINGNVKIPILNEDNLKVKLSYGLTKPEIDLDVTSNSKSLLQLTGEKTMDKIDVRFNSKAIGSITFNVKCPSASNSWNDLGFSVDVDGLWPKRITVSAGYDVRITGSNVPRAYLVIRRGTQVLEFNATVTLDSVNNAISINVKSPYEPINDVTLTAGLKRSLTSATFQMGARASDKFFALNLLYNPTEEEYITATFTSSITDYKHLKLDVKIAPSLRTAMISFSKGMKTIEFSYQISDSISVVYNNGFSGRWRRANLNLSWTLSMANLKMELDENKMEVIAKLEKSDSKSTILLTMQNDFIPKKDTFQIMASSDIQSSSNFDLTMKMDYGKLNLFDGSLSVLPDSLELHVISMMENIKLFRIKSNFETETTQKSAKVQVELNDKTWTSSGQITKNPDDDGITLQVDNSFPTAGMRNVKVVAKRDLISKKKLLGGELSVNGNILGSIEGTIEINYPTSVDAKLKVDTPWLKTDNLRLQLNRISEQMTAKLQWSVAKMIELKGKLNSREVELKVSTPFDGFESASFFGKLDYSSLKQISMNSQLTFQERVLTSVDFKFVNKLPYELDLNLDIKTPIKSLEKISFEFLYNFNAEVDILAKFSVNNNIFSLKSTTKMNPSGGFDNEIILQTPIRSFSNVKLTIDADKVDQSTYKLTINLELPSTSHSLIGSFSYKRDDITVEANIRSSLLQSKPLTMRLKILSDSLQAELITGEIKKFIVWSHKFVDSYSGEFTIAQEVTTTGEKRGLRWTYSLAKDVLDIKTQLKTLGGDNVLDFSLNSPSYKLARMSIVTSNIELISLNYEYSNQNIKYVVKVVNPLTDQAYQGDLNIIRTADVIKGELNAGDNYVRINIQGLQNDRRTIQVQLSAPTVNIPVVKIDAQVNSNENAKDMSLILSSVGNVYKMTAKISRENSERRVEATLETPKHQIELSLGGFYRDPLNFKAQLEAEIDGQEHAASLSIQKSGRTYTGKMNVDCVYLEPIEFSIQLDLTQVVDSSLSLNIGKVSHKGQLKVTNNNQELNIVLRIDTPKLNLRSISILKNSATKQLQVDSSTATHSLTLNEYLDGKTKKIRLVADTPYLKGGKYSLLGQNTENEDSSDLSLDLQTPTERNYISVNYMKKSKSIRLIFNLPALMTEQIKVTGNLENLDKNALDGSLEVIIGQTKHKLDLDIKISNRRLDYDIALQTPLFRIDTVRSQGQILLSQENRLLVDINLKKSGVTQSLKGTLKVNLDGMDGQLKLDTPLLPPLDISVRSSWAKPGEVTAYFSAQTPITSHNLELKLSRKGKDEFDGVLRINSPLLPGNTLSLSGNIAIHSPTMMQSYVALENPGNTFKLQSKLESEPENKRLRSHIILITPFDIAPFIKIAGQLTNQPQNIGGGIEIYNVDGHKPTFAINGQIQRDNANRLNFASLSLQLTSVKDLQLKYDASVSGQSLLTLNLGNEIYGYQLEHSRLSGRSKLNLIVFHGEKKSTFNIFINQSGYKYQLESTLDVKLGATPTLKLNVNHDITMDNTRELEIILNVGSYSKYVLRGELNYVNENNFRSLLQFRSPTNNHKINVMKFLDALMVNVLSKETVLLDLQVNKTLEQNKGKYQIRIVTPFHDINMDDASYEWSMDTFKLRARNGDKSIDVTSDASGANIQLNIFGQNSPMVIKYQKNNAQQNYKLNLEIPHRKYPLTLSLLSSTTSRKVFSYIGSIAWGNDDNSKITLRTEVDLQGPNYKYQISVVHPIRTIDLAAYYSINSQETTGTITLKLDAGKDLTKALSLRFKTQELNNEQRLEIEVGCPGISKLAMTSRTLTDSTVNRKLEVIYGLKSTEKVILDYIFTSDKFEVRIWNPETNYDVQLSANSKSDEKQLAGDVTLSYVDRYDRKQKLSGEISIRKDSPSVTILTSTSSSKMSLQARLVPIDNGVKMIIEKQMDNNKPNKLEMQFKRLENLKGVQLLIYNDFEGKSSTSASIGMPDTKTLRVSSSRTTDDVRKDDLDFQINIHEARELRTKFHWRPQAIRELQYELTRMLRDLNTNLETTLGTLKNSALKIIEKTQLAKQAIGKNFYSKSLSEELVNIKTDLRPLQEVLERVYKDDDFYVRSILNLMGPIQIHHKIIRYVTDVYDDMSKLLSKERLMSALNGLDSLRSKLKSLGNGLVERAMRQIVKVPQALIDFVQDMNEWGKRFINRIIVGGIKVFSNYITNNIPPIREWKDSIPQWARRFSGTVSDQLDNYIEEFKGSSYYKKLQQSIDQLVRVLEQIYSSQLWTKAKIYFDYVSEKVEDKWNAIQSKPWFQSLELYSEKTYEISMWAYKMFKVEEVVRGLLTSVLAKAEDVAIYVMEDMVLPQYQLPSLTSSIKYQPHMGVIEFNQTLPVPWASFVQKPDIYGSQEYQKLTHFKNDVLELPKNTVKKIYHALKSELSWKNAGTNFGATAFMAGNQHYVTFDGKAYEFSGSCSYLMAKDFADNKFSLSINYKLENNNVDGEKAVKNYFNLTLGEYTLNIKPDLSVRVNGETLQLPITLDGIKINRHYDQLSIEDKKRQVSFNYDAEFDILMFEIGGFYHGKTGGLFGTYDHEPHDDLSEPSGIKVSSLEKFAYSWEIGNGECKDHKNLARHSNVNSYEIQKKCKDVFNNHNLVTCTSKINKEPYMNMCINDVSLNDDPCKSAAVYVAQCKAKGHDVSMPDTCLQCQIGDEMVAQGQKVKITGSKIPRSADVVFIVQNNWHCSTTFPHLKRTVSTVTSYIEQSLVKSRARLTNNKYALVGVVGSGDSSSIQAISPDGEIFGDAQSVKRALNITHFSSGTHNHISEFVEYAYNLPYRAGASKIMVVLPCSESVDNEQEIDAIIEKLQEVNTVVHFITIHDLVINATNNVKANDLVGFDDEYAYTLKSIQKGELVGNKEIRNKITIPDNPLVTMAMETKGSVFMASRLGNLNPVIGSVANEVFSKRVASNAIPANCQNCLCTVGPDGSPRTLCSKCAN